MAAKDNPFYIEPVNAMQALMSGYQGYDTAQKAAKQSQLEEGRRAAAAGLQSGGDLKALYGQLLGLGDVESAKTVADFANQQATQQYHQQSLASTDRHQRVMEGQAAAGLSETRRQHDIGALQPVKIGTDAFGGDIYATRDPASGGYRPIDVKGLAGGPAGGSSPVGGGAAAGPITGEDYLKTIPEQAPLVKKIAQYEIDPRTFSTKGGHRERILSAVSQYDPTYDMTTFPTRSAAVKSFATGPHGNTLRSFDVSISHLNTLQELAHALDNGDIKLINSIRNKYQEQTGSTAPGNFEAAKGIVGDEISKAIIGSKGALADREEAKAQIQATRSPAQLAGVIKTYKELMAGQLTGIKKQYEDTTGLKNFESRLSPETLKELQRKPTAPAAGGAASSKIPPPPPGFVIQQPATGGIGSR